MTRLDCTSEKYLWIIKRGFVAKVIADEQLSEAETSSSASDDIKPGYWDKTKRNRNLFYLAVDSRHFVGAWAKSNEIYQANK